MIETILQYFAKYKDLISAAILVITLVGLYLRHLWKRESLDSQHITQFQERYRSPEMNEKLKILRRWKDNKWEVLHKWKDSKVQKDRNLAWLINEEAHRLIDFKELDEARRHVKYYFVDACELFELNLISQETCKRICSVEAKELLFDVCEPLEFATAHKWDEGFYKKIRELTEEKEFEPPKGL